MLWEVRFDANGDREIAGDCILFPNWFVMIKYRPYIPYLLNQKKTQAVLKKVKKYQYFVHIYISFLKYMET